MCLLFVGNGKSPLATSRFNMIGKVYEGELFFLDKSQNKISDKEGRVVSSWNGAGKIFYHINMLQALCAFLIRKKAKVIHYHGASHILLALPAMFFRGKVVVTPQGSDINQNFKSHYRIFTYMLLRRAEIITCKSAAMAKRVKEISGKDSVQLNWGTSCFFEKEDFFSDEMKGPPTIMSPRSNKPIYNVSTIFDAISMLREDNISFRFVYVTLHKKRDFDTSLADEIYYSATGSEMAQLIGRSDLIISIPSFDGFSTTIMESLFLGALPVISNLPAYDGELERAELAERIESISPTILYEKLKYLIKNIDVVRASRSKRREYALENYSKQKQLVILSKIYKN